jgi:holliday junction DNA helicase RuvB
MSETPSRSEITTPEALNDDEGVELSLRPQRLGEFIGQPKVKESLKIAIDAALNRREPLDHTLLYGPPGLGKTTLSMLMAREMGANVKITSGPVLEKPGDLVRELTSLRAGDILFIDEIHRLRPIIEEFLYPAMEDYRIDVRLSEGPNAQMISMPVEPFTLVGATTRFGLLTPPMRARFGIVQRLDYYPVDQLAFIVERSAEILNVGATKDGALEIAKRSRGTPRVANRLLRRVRDYAQVRADGVIDAEVADAALRMLDVDEFGLDEMDARVLRSLIEHFDGGPVGLNTLAVSISEDSGTLEEVYEPFLIQNGFLMRTPQGPGRHREGVPSLRLCAAHRRAAVRPGDLLRELSGRWKEIRPRADCGPPITTSCSRNRRSRSTPRLGGTRAGCSSWTGRPAGSPIAASPTSSSSSRPATSWCSTRPASSRPGFSGGAAAAVRPKCSCCIPRWMATAGSRWCGRARS